MKTVVILLLGVTMASAFHLSDERDEEERQLTNCNGGERPVPCRSLNGSICISFEDNCDGYSHCRQNIDEPARCVSKNRNEVKNLVHAFQKLQNVVSTSNGRFLAEIFAQAYRAFNEMVLILSSKHWNFPPEYTYLEQFYNDYIPRSLHRTLLYSDSDDPKMFAACLSTHLGLMSGWNNYKEKHDFISNKLQPIFKSLVAGGYFNSLK